MSNTDHESKAQFLEAVRDEGAVLNDVEYFTTGEGSSTSYKKRTDDGEVEGITKSDVEVAWNEALENGEEDEGEAEEKELEEVHLGTLYYSKSNWDDEHREQLERALAELDWKICSEVESGGYRIGTRVQ